MPRTSTSKSKSVAEKIGCTIKNEEECESPENFNCQWAGKRACIARKHVSRGRSYQSKDPDDFVMRKPIKKLRIKDKDSTVRKQPSSICATFEQNEAKCKKYDPFCKVTKAGCRYNSEAKITSKTRVPRIPFSTQYRSKSAQRLGKKPFTKGYDDLVTSKKQMRTSKSKPFRFEAFAYFKTVKNALSFSNKMKVISKPEFVNVSSQLFSEQSEAEDFVQKAKKHTGFLADRIDQL